MPASPNKPIMFAVVHETEFVTPIIDLFRETIRGKRTLYIEMSRFNPVNDDNLDFMRLANMAHSAGIKVVPLDSIEKQGIVNRPRNLPDLKIQNRTSRILARATIRLIGESAS